MVGKEGLAPSQPAAMVLQTIGLPAAQFPHVVPAEGNDPPTP